MRFSKMALAAATSLSLMVGSTAAQASACQPGGAGCVLPLPGPPTLPPVQTTAPVVDTVPVIEEGGFDLLPYLIGFLALAAVGAFLLLDDDEVVSP
jgi:hypothetical protein